MYTGSKIVTDGLIVAIDAFVIRGGPPDVINMASPSDAGSVNSVTRLSNGFDFSSSSSYIRFDHQAKFNNNTFSLEILFKTSDTNQDNYARLIAKDASGAGFGNYGIAGGIPSTYLRFGFYGTIASGNIEISNALYPDLNDGKNVWRHYIGTYDGANLYLYRNNIEIATEASIDTPVLNTNPITFGNDAYILGNYYGGGIAFARIYNRGLTRDEVTQNYKVAASRFDIP